MPSQRREGVLYLEEVDVGWRVSTEGFSTTEPTLSTALAAFNDWLRGQGTNWKVWRDERLEPGALRWFVVPRGSLHRGGQHLGDALDDGDVISRERPRSRPECSEDAEGTAPSRDDDHHAARDTVLLE